MATTSSTAVRKVNGPNCLILQLPVEIFSDILGLVIEAEDSNPYAQHARLRTALRLSSTCQRIRNTLLPDIYSDVDMYPLYKADIHEKEKLRKSALHLYEILRNNPELGWYCKNLQIIIDYPGFLPVPLVPSEFPESTLDAFGWLSHTRHLTIFGDYYTDDIMFRAHSTAIMTIALRSLPELTTLSLKGTNVHLPDIIDGMRDVGKCPNLALLELNCRSFGLLKVGEQWLGLIDFPGTAPFKKLDLRNFSFSPKVLEALVRWPKELHTLSCRPDIPQIDKNEWTWKTLQPIFEIQMASLRELHIYDLFKGDHFDIADLRGFTMLERLTLPATVVGFNKRHIPRIIGPNLQFFKWQVKYWDRDPRIIDEKHEGWIRAVVEYAAREQQKLKTIFINVEGCSWDFLRGIFTYPWDLLDDIARDAERVGICIQYDEPDMSREKYVAIVHGEPDDD